LLNQGTKTSDLASYLKFPFFNIAERVVWDDCVGFKDRDQANSAVGIELYWVWKRNWRIGSSQRPWWYRFSSMNSWCLTSEPCQLFDQVFFPHSSQISCFKFCSKQQSNNRDRDNSILRSTTIASNNDCTVIYYTLYWIFPAIACTILIARLAIVLSMNDSGKASHTLNDT
jgi:hypothetical protein